MCLHQMKVLLSALYAARFMEVKVTLVYGFAVVNATSGSIMTVPTWKEMLYLVHFFVRIVHK